MRYLYFLALVCATCVGCELVSWSVTEDPLTGITPALDAVGPATVDMLDALLTGGVVAGALAFLGTYGKTINRFYKAWQISRGQRK